MEFRQLSSFVTVVKCGSFSRAAELLFISQPSISTHIRLLEEELGTPLLDRSARNITLTAAGREFYTCADSALQMRDRMLSLRETRGTKVLRIGASTVPSAYVLPELIAAFSSEHSDVSFSVTQSDSRGISKGVSERLYDIGFVGAEAQDSSLRFHALCPDRMVLIAPDSELYRTIQKSSDPIPELLRCPVLLREEGSGSGGQMERLLAYAGLTENDLHIAARVNDHEAIKNMAAAGIGIACVSERAVSDERSRSRMLIFPLPPAAAERCLWLVHRRNELSDDIQQFRDFALHYAHLKLT